MDASWDDTRAALSPTMNSDSAPAGSAAVHIAEVAAAAVATSLV